MHFYFGAVATYVEIARAACLQQGDSWLGQAARSTGAAAASALPKVCRPSTLGMVIWPDASNAQDSMAAVSAEGSTVCVLMRRLNASCNRSMAFAVRAGFHWLGARRRKANS